MATETAVLAIFTRTAQQSVLDGIQTDFPAANHVRIVGLWLELKPEAVL